MIITDLFCEFVWLHRGDWVSKESVSGFGEGGWIRGGKGFPFVFLLLLFPFLLEASFD